MLQHDTILAYDLFTNPLLKCYQVWVAFLVDTICYSQFVQRCFNPCAVFKSNMKNLLAEIINGKSFAFWTRRLWTVVSWHLVTFTLGCSFTTQSQGLSGILGLTVGVSCLGNIIGLSTRTLSGLKRYPKDILLFHSILGTCPSAQV